MQEPEEICRAMFKFLGEPWEHGVLSFNDHDQGFGNEDPVLRGTFTFEPHLFDPKAISKRDVNLVRPILATVMRRTGYTFESAYRDTNVIVS